MTEVEVLTLERVVNIRGEEITVKPYSWMDTFRMAKPLQVILEATYANAGAIEALTNLTDKDPVPKAIKTLVDTFANIDDIDVVLEALSTVIRTAIGKNEAYMADLNLEEIYILGVAVFGVNKDFFTRIMGKIKEKVSSQSQKKSAHTK